MKKLFTTLAVSVATFAMFTAHAGSGIRAEKTLYAAKNISSTTSSYKTDASVTVCDTLVNLSLATDTPFIFEWSSPAAGYVAGNGALSNGTTLFPISGVGEEFSNPTAGYHVTQAVAFFGITVINAADSAMPIKAYVYNTAGTSPVGGIAPGQPLDSATVTFKSIATNVTNSLPTLFTFTHAANLSSTDFFITVSLPQTTGDTLVLLTTDYSSTQPHGNGWLHLAGAGWAPYDSITGGPSADFIIAFACKTTTGLASINAGISDFAVYPNPSNGVFTAAINLETASDLTISVVDLTGNKVFESTDKSVTSLNKPINLSTLAAGMYIVNVKTATGSVNQRIVIK